MKKLAITSLYPLRRNIEHFPEIASKGFTLAEVLITLGIIGIVAVLTIPNAIENYQSRAFGTAASNFERKLGEALRVMNTQMTLAGNGNTQNFVDELSRHIKIVKTCTGDKLLECFSDKVMWGGGDAALEEVEMKNVKLSKDFGQDDWNTNVVGVQFANGVNAMIAYNPKAKQDPFNNDTVTITGSASKSNGSVSLGTDALAILYDTNGFKSPNTRGKDLRPINVKKLANVECAFEINGTCYGAPFKPTPYFWKACKNESKSTDPEEISIMEQYGITRCTSNSEYGDQWAAIAIQCGGVDKMPTLAQINEIAKYLYDDETIAYNPGSDSYITKPRNNQKAIELGFISNELEFFGLTTNNRGVLGGHGVFTEYYFERMGVGGGVLVHSSSLLGLCVE